MTTDRDRHDHPPGSSCSICDVPMKHNEDMKRGEVWKRKSFYALFSRIKIEDVIENRVYYKCANTVGPFDLRIGVLKFMMRLYEKENA